MILGCDLAGTIAELGPDVTGFKVGDPVFAMMPHDWGAHAERVVLAQDLVVPIPDKLKLQPVVDKVFPLSEVAAAQEYSKAGRAKGKIILEL